VISVPGARRAPRARSAILAIFAVSGACALVYQVLWIRLLNLVFGATSFAMALVLAAFMSGLGLGSLLAGRWADSLRAPIRAYAFLEVGIACAGLAVPMLVPGVDRLQAALLGTDASLSAVLTVQGLSCFVLLLVPTTAMGATLPVLSAWISRDEHSRGRDLGTLYAVNTLGAVAGTVFTGFFAIEHLGIPLSNSLAVATNLGAAALALWLSRTAAAQIDPPEASGDAAAREQQPAGLAPLLAMACAAGFLGLAHEVVWTRLIGMVVWTTTYAYTTILATVIGGIGLGSLLAAPGTDRCPDPVRRFGYLQLGIGASALGIFPILLALVRFAPGLLGAPGESFAHGQALSVMLCVAVTALPALLMGATWPALARAVVHGRGSVGRQVGRLYLSNTLGAVLGSFVAGFLLLPWIGSLAAVTLLAGLNVVLGAVAARPGSGAGRPSRLRYAAALTGAGALLAATLGSVDIRDLYEAQLPEGSEILSVREGVTSTVMVADHAEDPPVRRLWIQSAWVAGSGGGHVMIGHLGALHAPKTERGLGIAFGTGQSFAAALRHGFERLDCVDLNQEVIDAGAKWFAEHNGRLLQQPGVSTYVQDGRSFLARTDARYDVIMMEPLQPWSAGAVNLYTREFYQLAASRLVPGGVVTQWMPIDDVPVEITRSVVATLAEVFAQVWIYLDYGDLVIVAGNGGAPIQVAKWRERIARPGIATDLAAIDYDDVQSVLSTLLVGPQDIAAYAGDAPLLTDARPFMEFAAPRTMYGSWFESNVEALASNCRSPMAGFVSDSSAPLPEALISGALARTFAAYLVAMNNDQREDALVYARAAYELSPDLVRARGYYRTTTWLVAREREQRDGPEAAARAYREHLQADPEFLGMWLNLALLEQRMGNASEALRLLEEVEGKPGEFADQVAVALQELRR
jgi:spermidine synthase